jgi:hypothetical protein
MNQVLSTVDNDAFCQKDTLGNEREGEHEGYKTKTKLNSMV